VTSEDASIARVMARPVRRTPIERTDSRTGVHTLTLTLRHNVRPRRRSLHPRFGVTNDRGIQRIAEARRSSDEIAPLPHACRWCLSQLPEALDRYLTGSSVHDVVINSAKPTTSDRHRGSGLLTFA
jgi:hypothetical protein